MRNTVFLPVNLIKCATDENWSISAAYFIKLKSLHRNNTHYGFTLRSLASKINCTAATLQRHLKVLKDKGLVRYHGGNITFLGLKKLNSIYGFKNIGVPVDFKNQHNILRGQIIRFNLSAQSYSIKKSGLQLCRQGGLIPNSSKEKINSRYTGLSAKGIGNLFDLSLATGSRIRKKLHDLSLVRKERVYTQLYHNVSRSDFRRLRNLFAIPSYSFFSNGSIFIERRSKMEYCMPT